MFIEDVNGEYVNIKYILRVYKEVGAVHTNYEDKEKADPTFEIRAELVVAGDTTRTVILAKDIAEDEVDTTLESIMDSIDERIDKAKQAL